MAHNPTVPCGFVLAPQSHFGERGMNAVANDPAIPKPEFVDAVWACLTRPLGPEAIDDIHPGAGDGLQNLPGRLL